MGGEPKSVTFRFPIQFLMKHLIIFKKLKGFIFFSLSLFFFFG